MISIEKIFTGRYEAYEKGFKDKYTAVIDRVVKNASFLLDDSGYEIYMELTDNERIQSINLNCRNTDKPTDVLSFPQYDFYDGEGTADEEGINPETDCVMLGDIIISLEKAAAQAEEYGHQEEREVAFLAIHGLLHLLGFDHDTKEREELMLNNAYRILEEAGYTR